MIIELLQETYTLIVAALATPASSLDGLEPVGISPWHRTKHDEHP